MAGEFGTGLATRLREAKDAVARLEALAGAATCADMGEHDWRFIGSRWCGCADGSCGVPVYECARCKDCDYGDSAEADDIRLECARAFETEEEAIRRRHALAQPTRGEPKAGRGGGDHG